MSGLMRVKLDGIGIASPLKGYEKKDCVMTMTILVVQRFYLYLELIYQNLNIF